MMHHMSSPAGNSVSRTRRGTAVRQRGKDRAASILSAAKKILVEEGLASLSTRRVADELGISVGNLAYYFPSKDSLLQAIVEHVIEGYDQALARESASFPDDPVRRFSAFMQYMIEDARKPEVRRFFYQFWGLSTHHEQVAVARRAMYEHFARQTADLLQSIHPQKGAAELETIAYSILAFTEGLHVVFGSGDIKRIQTAAFGRHALRQLLSIAGVSSPG